MKDESLWDAINLKMRVYGMKDERAAERIHSHIIRRRLETHDTALIAYQKGGMVAAEINAILAEEFCQELLAPVVAAYEDEKSRILG